MLQLCIIWCGNGPQEAVGLEAHDLCFIITSFMCASLVGTLVASGTRETEIEKEIERETVTETGIETERGRGRGIDGPLDEDRDLLTSGTGIGDAPGPTHHLTGRHGDG